MALLPYLNNSSLVKQWKYLLIVIGHFKQTFLLFEMIKFGAILTAKIFLAK